MYKRSLAGALYRAQQLRVARRRHQPGDHAHQDPACGAGRVGKSRYDRRERPERPARTARRCICAKRSVVGPAMARSPLHSNSTRLVVEQRDPPRVRVCRPAGERRLSPASHFGCGAYAGRRGCGRGDREAHGRATARPNQTAEIQRLRLGRSHQVKRSRRRQQSVRPGQCLDGQERCAPPADHQEVGPVGRAGGVAEVS